MNPSKTADPSESGKEPQNEDGQPQADSHASYYATVRQLFREHNRALVNFLLTRVPTQQDALDVAQECYVRLLQLDRPGAVGFLRGYLFRIAANLAVDRVRRIQVREREGVGLFEAFTDAEAADVQAITDQEVGSVAQALRDLPPKCREAFILHIVEGYDTAEIATRMKVRDRQVRRYIARALRHCQDHLNRSSTDGGS
jgi:RNA polymerase sigma-70 factor (ECF subfamily)